MPPSGASVEVVRQVEPDGVGEVAGLGPDGSGAPAPASRDEVGTDLRPGPADDDLDGVGEPGGRQVGGGPLAVAAVGDERCSDPAPTTTQPSEPPNDVSQRMFEGVETISVAPSRRARTASGRAA